MRANDESLSPNLQEFYKAFFGRLPTLRLIFPAQGRDDAGPRQEEFSYKVCGAYLSINQVKRTMYRSCTDFFSYSCSFLPEVAKCKKL